MTTTATTRTRRLTRSATDRHIAGVCGGLARYLGWDPSTVRLLTVLSIFLPGPQLLAYLIGWAVIPDERRLAT